MNRSRTSAPRLLLALAAAAAALAHPAGGAAQVRSELSAGAGVLERGPAASSALLLGGVLEARAPHAILRAAGNTARFTDGGADAEGSLSALLRTGRLGGLVSGEIAGAARQLSYRGFDERWRVDVAAGPRLTLGSGTSVRARGGISLYSDGVRPRDAFSADLYVRHEVGRAFVTFSASRMAFAERAVVFRDTVFYVGGFPFRSRSQSIEDRSRAYTDLEAGLYIPVLRGDLELSAGRRSGELESPGAMWGRVATAVPLSRRMAMVAEAGSRASTPEERLPAGRFFSVGMRLLSDGPRRHFSPPPAPPGAPALELVPAPEGARTLRLSGVDGRQVALLADFTDWSPVEMTRTPAGEWELTLVLAPGSYRLCLRADGGACLPPPGLPTVEDEFGGQVGILLVN